MCRKLILIFCCLVSVLTFGQKKKFHIVKLLPNKDEPVEAVDFYISEVIDNRVYKDNIGIAQKGIFNKKVLSKFDKPFEEAILEYLNSVFPVDDSKTNIVLRINQLLISENTGAFKETGKAIVNLDVLKKTDDNYFLLGSYSSYKEKNSADVTGKHDDRIRAILVDCLLEYQFKLKFESELIEPKLISVESLSKPALLENDIKQGFFQTFNELYNNAPFVDSSIKFRKKTNQNNNLFLQDIELKRNLYFAFYDGASIYLNAANYSGEKHFVRTELVDRFLVFNDAFVHQDEAAVMSMAFGVLGILATNKKSHVLLDLYSGQFHVLKENKIKVLLQNHKELYEVYKSNRDDTLVMKEILETLFTKEDAEVLRKTIRS